MGPHSNESGLVSAPQSTDAFARPVQKSREYVFVFKYEEVFPP